MHNLSSMFLCVFSYCTAFDHFLRRPKRCAPKFYVKSRLNCCVSFVLDPIGDRNDVYICPPLIGGPPYRAGAAWPMPRTGPGRAGRPMPRPMCGGRGAPVRGAGGGAPAGAPQRGPSTSVTKFINWIRDHAKHQPRFCVESRHDSFWPSQKSMTNDKNNI